MDKEKTREFNRKLKDLQSAVDEKNQQLVDYQDIEKIADEKIRALNAIHAEKIRALMNSIQLLKKENASMGKQSKEHKRSEFIQQLNKEIADQDTVIEVLRGLVNDNKKADAAIISTLTKGPARVRVATREEMKIELKELKAKVLKYEKKKGGANAGTEDDKMAEMDAQNMSAISMPKQTGTKMGAGNAEFIIKINELNNQIEDLNLLISGKQTENDKYRSLISHKNQEIIELTQAKIDLKFMSTKNDELKNEIEGLKQKLYSDLYANYDQEIKLGELELANTVHKNLQNKTNEAIKLEMETLQIRIAELAGQNKQLVSSNTKLKDENLNVRSQLDEAKERNRTIRAGHEEQLEKVNQIVRSKEDDIKTFKSKIVEFENTFDGLKIEVRDKESIIADLENKIRALEEAGPRGSHRSDGSRGSGGQAAVAFNEELEAKNLELEQEINHMDQENFRLKERAKELIKNEIELSDRIDILEQENKLLNRKVIAANLITKDTYKDSVSMDQMHAHLKEASSRYEARIKELTKKMAELEARNNELEDVQRIMNNQSMTSVTSSRLNTET